MRHSLNPPYAPPPRHYRLDDQFRAAEEPVNGRLPSGAYLPVPLADRNTAPQPADTLDVHKRINQIRRHVETWRKRAYPGVHRVSRELLEYWSSSASEPRPFFAQVEALETLIWLAEVAPDNPSSRSILDKIRSINDNLNRGIFRLAIKMATGTGKTRIMAMIILWHALKESNPLHVLVMAPNLRRPGPEPRRHLGPTRTTSRASIAQRRPGPKPRRHENQAEEPRLPTDRSTKARA